jgi:hypothetical protein
MPITPVIRLRQYPGSRDRDLSEFVNDALAYLMNNPYEARENVEYTPALDIFNCCENLDVLDNVKLFLDIIYVKLLLTLARRGGQSEVISRELDLAITRLTHHIHRKRIHLNLWLTSLKPFSRELANRRLPESFPELRSYLVEPPGPQDTNALLAHLTRLAIYAIIQQQTLRVLVNTIQNEADSPETPFEEAVREEILATDISHGRQMGFLFNQMREGKVFPQVSLEARQRCADAFIQANENVVHLFTVVQDTDQRRRPFVLLPTARQLPYLGEENFIAAAASIVDGVPLALPSTTPSPADVENIAQRIISRFNAWLDVVAKENLAVITRNRQNPLVNQVSDLHNEVVDLTNQVSSAETHLIFSINFANVLVSFLETDQLLKSSIAEVLTDPTSRIPMNRIPELISILGRSNQLMQQSALTILGVRDIVAGAREGSPLLHLEAWVNEDTGTVPRVEAANSALDTAMSRIQNRMLPAAEGQPAQPPVHQLAETVLTNGEASIFAGGHYQDTSGFRLLLGLKVARPFDWAEKPNARVSVAFEKVISNQLPWSGEGFGLNVTTKIGNGRFAFSHQTLKTGETWDTCDTLSATGPSRGHIISSVGVVACETGAVGFQFARFFPGSALFTPSKACRFVAPVISVGTDLRAEDHWSFILAPPSGVSSLNEHRASSDMAFLTPKTGFNMDAQAGNHTALLLRDAILLIDFTAVVRALVNSVLLLVLIRIDGERRHPAIKCLARVLMMKMAGAYMSVTIFSIAHMGFNALTGRNLYWKSPPVQNLFIVTEDLFNGTMTTAPDDSIYKLFNFVSLLFCFQYVRNYILTLPRSRVAGLVVLQVIVGFVVLFVVTPQVRRWVQNDEL